jgi:hypothetical protein
MEKRQEILRLSGLAEAHWIDTYLGLLSFVSRTKKQAFSFIKDKVWRKISNWKTFFLSQASKEILLITVVQAISTCCMGVFQLLISLCKDIISMMQNFWWSHMNKNSRIHWMIWERMGRSKSVGGMGFRDLVLFNKAMLARQGWGILQNPSSLMVAVIQAKYFPHGDFLKASLGNKPSFA